MVHVLLEPHRYGLHALTHSPLFLQLEGDALGSGELSLTLSAPRRFILVALLAVVLAVAFISPIHSFIDRLVAPDVALLPAFAISATTFPALLYTPSE